MDNINARETWNKKRIFAVLFLVILLITGVYLFKSRFLDLESSPADPKSVKGVSVKDKKGKEDLTTDIKEAVKEKINSLKQEVSSLNIMEIASSSPQIQKIINDIKVLEQYPTNQAREICKQICGL